MLFQVALTIGRVDVNTSRRRCVHPWRGRLGRGHGWRVALAALLRGATDTSGPASGCAGKGQPEQVIPAARVPAALARGRRGLLPAGRRGGGSWSGLAEEERRHRFTWRTPPALRFTASWRLLRPRWHAWSWTNHHILLDGLVRCRSCSGIVRDLPAGGDATGLPRATQLTEYLAWVPPARDAGKAAGGGLAGRAVAGLGGDVVAPGGPAGPGAPCSGGG